MSNDIMTTAFKMDKTQENTTNASLQDMQQIVEILTSDIKGYENMILQLSSKLDVCERKNQALTSKMKTQEKCHAVEMAKLKGEVDRLTVFTGKLWDIRRRSLENFKREIDSYDEELRSDDEFDSENNAICPIDYWGDARLDMELFASAADDEIFKFNYGISADILRKHKDNDRLIAVLDCCCTYWDAIFSECASVHIDLISNLCDNKPFTSQLRDLCKRKHVVTLRNGATLKWDQVVELRRRQISSDKKKSKFEFNEASNFTPSQIADKNTAGGNEDIED